MDLAGALTAVTAGLRLAKELRDIDHQLDAAELKLKLVDVTEALADAKSALIDAQAALGEKDAQIDDLSKRLRFRETKLVDRGQFRYFANDDGNARGRPVCPRCEARGEYLQLAQDRSKGIGRITYYCPGCKANYGPHVPIGR